MPPLPQSILSPSPLPRPVASHDNKRWTKATDTGMSGVGFLQKKSETLDFDIFFFFKTKKVLFCIKSRCEEGKVIVTPQAK